MESVLNYLERPKCTKCKFTEEGELKHCVNCEELYQKAIATLKKQKLSLDEIGRLKKTHSWVGSKNYNALRTSMQPFTSHCQKCGIKMHQFKAEPKRCSKENT